MQSEVSGSKLKLESRWSLSLHTAVSVQEITTYCFSDSKGEYRNALLTTSITASRACVRLCVHFSEGNESIASGLVPDASF